MPDLSKGGLKLTNLVCNKFALDGVESQLSNGNATLDVTVRGLGFRCVGEAKLDLKVLGVSLLSLDKTIEIEVSPSSFIVMQFQASETLIKMSALDTQIKVDTVRIGSLSVPSVVLSLTREIFSDMADSIGKRLFNDIVADSMAKMTILAQSPLPPFFDTPNPPPAMSLDLRKSLVATVAETSAKLGPVATRLAAALSGTSLNASALSAMLPHPFVLSLPLPGNLGSACAYVNVTSLRFNRLDPMRFSLTTPAPYDMSMSMGSEGVLDVSVGLSLVLSSSWGPTIALNVTTTLRATRANFVTAMWLSVNEAAIQAAKLFTDLLASPSCPPINDLAVKGLAVSFETAFMRMDLDPSSSGLQKDFFAVINNANLFVVSSLKDKLAPILSYMSASADVRRWTAPRARR